MRRLRLLSPLLLLLACLAHAASEDFRGVWTGTIRAPNADAALGLAFVPTDNGLLVSLDFPEMFLHGVNFGRAAITGDTFTLAPLALTLSREGDTLKGHFGPARLPVELQRGGNFTTPPSPVAPPAAPAPLWSRSLGAPVWASPVVFGDAVYVPATDGTLHAISTTDGAELWRWQGPAPLYGQALATVDSVYVVDDRNDLIALDRLTGTLRWRTPLHDRALAGGPVPVNETFNHRTTSPVIDPKGILYVGSTDDGLYAIRARNGRKLWRHDAKARIYAPVALRGEELVVACFDGSLFTLNRRTRLESSRVKLGGPLVSAPVLAGDRVIVGARDYLLYGLRPSGETAWRNSFWFSWIESTPRLVDGVLYIGGSDFRRISALNPQDGARLWATDVLGLTWGTPVITASTVFAATAGQNIPGTVIQHTGGIAALDRATGAWKWRYTAPVAAGADFTGFAGSLALAGDRIIAAGVDGQLLAFPTLP